MRGVWTALVTPFTSSDELDLEAFRRILIDQRDAGVAGVIPCGTTGESPTLTLDEKKLLISTAIETLKGSKCQVIAGTGSNNTRETVALSHWASTQGVAGVLVVTPYYNKPTPAGLEAHFLAVAEALTGNCELMLYNVPGRTGVSLTSESVVRLARNPRIRSIKEASGVVGFSTELAEALKSNSLTMDIYSGDDALFLPLLSLGAVGVVSVSSNLFPRGMVALQKAYEEGRADEALRLHNHYSPLFRDLFVESNPGPIKAAMKYAGWCDSSLRLPLVPMSAGNLERLMTSLKRCEIQPGRPQ